MKAVSFSLYGDKDIYNCGAVSNVKLVAEHLPGWTAYFFLGPSVTRSLEDSLIELGARIVRVNEAETPIAMTWRFRAASLDNITHVIFRDCDSRISSREASCVQQWVQSGKFYHIIRDHPWHSSPIMGGLWGVTGKSELHHVAQVAREEASLYEDAYGLDQRLVSERIYPRAMESGSYYVHDAFRSREKGVTRPPERQDGSFMGERISCDGSYDQKDREAVASHERSFVRRAILRTIDIFLGARSGAQAFIGYIDKWRF